MVLQLALGTQTQVPRTTSDFPCEVESACAKKLADLDDNKIESKYGNIYTHSWMAKMAVQSGSMVTWTCKSELATNLSHPSSGVSRNRFSHTTRQIYTNTITNL